MIWLWSGFIALIVVSFNPILCLILLLSIPRLVSLFRKRTDEEKRYFEVTAAQRALMAFLYFGLAAVLAAGMSYLHRTAPIR